MSLLKIIILAVVQGLAELLPVSSSAHVVVAEKLLGLDPSTPSMTLLLVMLHTGTMFAVIVYFWKQWQRTYFQSMPAFKTIVVRVSVATLLTGLVGEVIIKTIEAAALGGRPHAEIEELFGHLEFIAPALAIAGILIFIAGILEKRQSAPTAATANPPTLKQASLIGLVQGLCLPFRGFSRSGATISTGMLLGIEKSRAEAFSFALAVVITPPVLFREAVRLVRSPAPLDGGAGLSSVVLMSLLGAVVAFLAGLIALKWLSRWLENGRWHFFGIYCLVAAGVVFVLYRAGY